MFSWGFLFLYFSGILRNESGTPEDEENFEEAIKNVNTALNPTKVHLLTWKVICVLYFNMYWPLFLTLKQISSAVEDIFNMEQCENITSQVHSFLFAFLLTCGKTSVVLCYMQHFKLYLYLYCISSSSHGVLFYILPLDNVGVFCMC